MVAEGQTDYANMHAKVPGRQTVPRAELWALICVLRLQRKGYQVEYYIDAKYVVDGMTIPTDDHSTGINGDIWVVAYSLLSELRQ